MTLLFTAVVMMLLLPVGPALHTAPLLLSANALLVLEEPPVETHEVARLCSALFGGAEVVARVGTVTFLVRFRSRKRAAAASVSIRHHKVRGLLLHVPGAYEKERPTLSFFSSHPEGQMTIQCLTRGPRCGQVRFYLRILPILCSGGCTALDPRCHCFHCAILSRITTLLPRGPAVGMAVELQ